MLCLDPGAGRAHFEETKILIIRNQGLSKHVAHQKVAVIRTSIPTLHSLCDGSLASDFVRDSLPVVLGEEVLLALLQGLHHLSYRHVRSDLQKNRI